MSLNCFGKKKKKEPRTPLPSRESLDRPVVVRREDTQSEIECSPAPPALPQRQKLDDPDARYKLDGTYQHSQKIAVNQSGSSPEPKRERTKKSTRQSKIPLAHQLSQQVLSTPIPIGGGVEPHKTSPDPVREDPIGQESGEDYLDPQKTQPEPEPSSSPAVSPVGQGRQKPIASISEIKKSEIFNDYFSADSSLSVSVSAPEPHEESHSHQDYTNLADLPEPFSPKHIQKPAHSPVRSDSYDPVPKSPRRPRPVPRSNTTAAGSASSSRKHSLTSSENEESTFTYENVEGILSKLPDCKLPETPTSHDVSPITPKPLPRARAATEPSKQRLEDTSLSQSMNVYIPSPAANLTARSPLQQQKVKDGYVLEADYVPPSDKTSPTTIHSSTSAPLPQLPNGGPLPHTPGVDLKVPVPRTSADSALITSQPKKAYLPMDQSPKTRAIHHEDSTTEGPMNGHSPTDISINLNMRVPVGNVNDVHVPGYITILGNKTPAQMHSGPYYNISDRTDYVNPGDPAAKHIKPGGKKTRQPNAGKETEAIYY